MKTLYFIGNGFDIAHDIKSRYRDFRDFMNASKEYDDLVTMLEELYGCTVKDLWCEFEKALALITGKAIYEDAFYSNTYSYHYFPYLLSTEPLFVYHLQKC